MTEVADLTIRKTKSVAIAKALAMVAIIAVAVAVSIVVRYLGDSRDGWKAVAEQATAENDELRVRLEAQGVELACRSEAAAIQSAAMGELTINIGETAEAALRLAAGEPIGAIVVDIANRLQASSTAVREATVARDAAFESCTLGGD